MKAYLVQGTPAVGKTTFSKTFSANLRGECLSYERFFYEYVEPDKPDVFSFDSRRVISSLRWYWSTLKDMCDRGVEHIVIDQNNFWDDHTVRTAAFLVERYDYELELPHPNHHWTNIRGLLRDKQNNSDEVRAWASKLGVENTKGYSSDQLFKYMMDYREYTVEELMEYF